MTYTLFYDTNALLDLQEKAFEENFIISQKTLEEIENIKTSSRKDEEIKWKARRISRLLDKNYDKYDVVICNTDILEIISKFNLQETPDNIILASAYKYGINKEIILVSDDINVKNLSRMVFNLYTKGTDDLDLIKSEEYKGYKEITMSEEEMAYFYSKINENIYDLLINQYLIIKLNSTDESYCYRWNGESHKSISWNDKQSMYFGKIKPKDPYQQCLMDSIDKNIITAISGKAGSGKSLLSLTSAINLIESGEKDRIVILFNPTKAKGASDMGFYTGSSTDKAMSNSIGNILITKFGDPFAVELLLSQNKIKLVSMADCRGMEISDNEILWVTEAQNTSIELIKLCLSRCSSGAKIIIEGDYTSQVDGFAFEGRNNGLKRVVDVFKNHEEFGYIELKNVWRSKIAELCELL